MAITKKQSDALAKQVFEYAPAPEAIDHVKIQPRYGLFIGGRMVEGHSKKHFPTINPATEKKLAEVVEAAARSYRGQTETSYYADNLRLLEPAYLRAETAEAGSGFGRDTAAATGVGQWRARSAATNVADDPSDL